MICGSGLQPNSWSAKKRQLSHGNWRKVEIKVKRPDARLQSRKGYFAPYKP